jgi:uncharacterized cofD-like protein
MPSLLLPELLAAIRNSSAVKLYVCNVATQRGETQGYDLADHVAALERHTGPGWIDVVLANNRFDAKRPGSYAAEPVKLRWPPVTIFPDSPTPRLVLEDVVDPENAHHHESARLATAVIRVYERESFGRHRSRVSRTA